MDDEEQPIPHSQKLTASSILHIEPENYRTSNLNSHFPPRLPPNVASDSTLSQIPPYSCSCDKRNEKEVRSIHHSLNGKTSDFDMKPQNSPPRLHLFFPPRRPPNAARNSTFSKLPRFSAHARWGMEKRRASDSPQHTFLGTLPFHDTEAGQQESTR